MKTGTFVIVPMCVCIIVSGCGDRTEKPKAADGSGSTAAEVQNRTISEVKREGAIQKQGDVKQESTMPKKAEVKIENTVPKQDLEPHKNDEKKGVNVVTTEQQAIEIAKQEVQVRMTNVKIPKDTKIDVKFEDGKYKITFLEPPLEFPIPRAGYYAIVIVDANTGETKVYGGP